MWDVVLGTLCLFCIFLGIGLGPTLWLFSYKKPEEDRLFTLAVAPVIGVVLTTLVGTYCVLWDLPIEAWGKKWLTISLLFSTMLMIVTPLIRRIQYGSSEWCRQPVSQSSTKNKTTFILSYSGFLLCCIFLLLPLLLGGLNYTILRGNGTDTFNYITMAGYLIHEPLSWVYSAPITDLVAKHPSYSLAYVLFTKTRWSTSMLMGWCSYITHIPLYRFEFGFTTLFYLMLYGVSYCFAASFSLKPRYALLIALAICLGFYGQFVLDVRAISQVSTLPLLVLIALLGTSYDTTLKNRGAIAAGLTLAAFAMLYIELMPTLILGFFLFFLVEWISRQETIASITKKFTLPLLIALIALAPIMHYLATIFLYQLHYASSTKNTWEVAYFSWLYRKPVIGFWGLSIINPSAQHGATFFHHMVKWVLDLLCVLMTTVFVYCLIPHKHHVSRGITLSITLFIAALCQLLYLIVHEQFWAAGKVLTFAFPFIYFVVGGFLSLQQNSSLKKIGQFAVLTWLVIQCGLSVYRIKTVLQQTFYVNYISPHSEYHAHDWRIDHIANAIKTQHIQTLGIKMANPWLTEYVSQVFGWDIPVFNLNGQMDRGNFVLNPKTIPAVPVYFIVASHDPVIQHADVIAEDPEFVLIRRTRSGDAHVIS